MVNSHTDIDIDIAARKGRQEQCAPNSIRRLSSICKNPQSKSSSIIKQRKARAERLLWRLVDRIVMGIS